MAKNEEIKRELEANCRKCQEDFFTVNKGNGRPFPYIRCKRCDTGRRLHEMDDPGWFHDYVKQEQ